MRERILIDNQPFQKFIPNRSIFYGEGLFETFRWKSKTPTYFAMHTERMKDGARVLGIPFPKVEEIKDNVQKAVSEANIADAYVKLCLLSKGSSIFYEEPLGYSILVVVRDYQPPEEPMKVKVSSYRRNSTNPILGIKSLNYLENLLANKVAKRSGFDEAIFINERGEITEGTTTNIFFIQDDVLFTPTLVCGLLSGVVRGIVIELASEYGIEVREGRYDLARLKSSNGAFLTNSLIGGVEVSMVDDIKLPPGSDMLIKIKSGLINKLGWA
jgi:4-amino-4-deoxychorismate lyase